MRIVLATFGSFGDLHPYLAVALALKARGHAPVLATSDFYRAKVEALGLGFAPVRPDHPGVEGDPEEMRRFMDPRRGTERIVRELFMPFLRESYDDLLAACRGADAIVSHPLTWTVPLAAATLGLPWASSHLAPIGLFSAHDPPVLSPAPFLERLRPLGPGFHRLLFAGLRRGVRGWTRPWHRLRDELGLPPTGDNPLFEGQNSPALVLALFSPALAAPQPDWPRQTRVTGFPFYDQETAGAGLPPELSAFLEDGPPPVVFTLGTSAVRTAGDFFTQSVGAAERLGRRAVLLIGNDARNRPARPLPAGMLAVEYAPFSGLFPRAAAVVHQGGIGTTGQAMRAGAPALVIPFSHDQHDNAARVRRLGIARALPRSRYRAGRVAAELGWLLDDAGLVRRAGEIGARVRAEDGAGAAAAALAELLA